ncbi:thioredoxin domain-containing protein [Candidatus Woesearchaeota archaeon]|nr:thioredoxin domain-containing protein [Candidatus Woesearchaeota archaeon]
MICLLALIIFGILGIFSVSHRKIAKEAFFCIFRRITLRKCESGLDKRLKSQITGKLLRKTPKFGAFVYKHFEIISWAFTILFVWSIISAAIGGYNYYLYGNCDGPNEEGFCIFDPTGHHTQTSLIETGVCADPSLMEGQLTMQGVDFSSFPSIERGSENTLILIGCYGCDYTREIMPTISKLLEKKKPNYVFAHLPITNQSKIHSKYGNCIYDQEKIEFWKFHNLLFNMEKTDTANENKITEITKNLNINLTLLEECVQSQTADDLVEHQIAELQKTGVYGTPTVFINGQPVVGPKPYRVYSRLLK